MASLKILYMSVHEVLEYDDLLMFTSRGHRVFSIGRFTEPDENGYNFRVPSASFFQSDLITQWRSDGLTRGFALNFDVVVVNHETWWISAHLHLFDGIPIIYRSIGQSTPDVERAISALGDRISVVRYSETERDLDGFAKTDEVIYFAKDINYYGGWTGGEVPITFHNRFPLRQSVSVPSADSYKYIVEGSGAKLYGIENDGFDNWGGLLESKHMPAALRGCACYVYVWTTPPSYTLSLMEAMLTGAPVVAPSLEMIENTLTDVNAGWDSRRYEVPKLLEDENALIYRTPAQAKEFVRAAIDRDPAILAMAETVRTRARAQFDMVTIGDQWDRFFARIV